MLRFVPRWPRRCRIDGARASASGPKADGAFRFTIVGLNGRISTGGQGLQKSRPPMHRQPATSSVEASPSSAPSEVGVAGNPLR